MQNERREQAHAQTRHLGAPLEADLQDGALKFAQCMREHGVDMPDPQFSEDGAMTVSVPSATSTRTTS